MIRHLLTFLLCSAVLSSYGEETRAPSQIHSWELSRLTPEHLAEAHQKIDLRPDFVFNTRPIIYHSTQNDYRGKKNYLIVGDLSKESFKYMIYDTQTQQAHVLEDTWAEPTPGGSVISPMNGVDATHSCRVIAMGEAGVLLESDGFYTYRGKKVEFKELMHDFFDTSSMSVDAPADFGTWGYYRSEKHTEDSEHYLCHDLRTGYRMSIPQAKIAGLLGGKEYDKLTFKDQGWLYYSQQSPTVAYLPWGASEPVKHEFPFIVQDNREYDHLLGVDRAVYVTREDDCHVYDLTTKKGTQLDWPSLPKGHPFSGRESEFGSQHRRLVHLFPDGEVVFIKRSLDAAGHQSLFQVIVMKDKVVKQQFATVHESDLKHTVQYQDDFGMFRQIDKYLLIPRSFKGAEYIYDCYDVTEARAVPAFSLMTKAPCHFYYYFVDGRIWAFSHSKK